jgi:putative holliday junction resolvase
MAIDYGSKRTGLAVTDPMQMFATALTTVNTHDLLSYLKEYLQKEPVEMIVVGEAKHLDGTPAQSAPIIEAFVKQLRKNFPALAIEREDERFTSKMAFQTMIDSGISKSKRRDKGLVDKISAVIILQSYMERRGNLREKFEN